MSSTRNAPKGGSSSSERADSAIRANPAPERSALVYRGGFVEGVPARDVSLEEVRALSNQHYAAALASGAYAPAPAAQE